MWHRLQSSISKAKNVRPRSSKLSRNFTRLFLSGSRILMAVSMASWTEQSRRPSGWSWSTDTINPKPKLTLRDTLRFKCFWSHTGDQGCHSYIYYSWAGGRHVLKDLNIYLSLWVLLWQDFNGDQVSVLQVLALHDRPKAAKSEALQHAVLAKVALKDFSNFKVWERWRRWRESDVRSGKLSVCQSADEAQEQFECGDDESNVDFFLHKKIL